MANNDMQFFLPMIPPTVTAQEHKVSVRKGKPVFYDPPELKETRAKLTAFLAKHKPEKPYTKGVHLEVRWCFPCCPETPASLFCRSTSPSLRATSPSGEDTAVGGNGAGVLPARKFKHRDGEYRTTRPDTDNLQKLLKDCMTAVGFWKDDALVASELCEKFWAQIPGIFIKIEVLE